ncbi:MAG TPA: hypothetical protein VM369_11760 [Candidatus Binatia bacterium]|nr:hypothetical protein [Candidatus Binatia bacterium]
MRLQPPTAREIRDNLRLLAADWKQHGAAMRYFVVSHLLSNAVLMAASAASIVALLLDRQALQIGLLAAAGIGAVQSALTWGVLQRRYKVRYELL